VTGGNLYDRAVIKELLRRGWDVDVEEPGGSVSGYDVVVVDSLALRHAPTTDVSTVVLLHQLPSEAERRPEWLEAERTALARAHLVITVSDHLARRARDLTAAAVVAIPPGWDRACAHRRLPGPEVVLCVASAHPGKGLPEAVGAFARSSAELELVVVGDPLRDPGEADRLRGAMRSTPRPVRLAGVVSAPDLASLYSRALVLLTASRYEGWPIAVGEAMASGVPVVGFDAPGVGELVRSGVDGMLVPGGDVASLGREVGKVAGDRELARCLGRSARRRARAWPTWAVTARRFASEIGGLSSYTRAARPGQATGAR